MRGDMAAGLLWKRLATRRGKHGPHCDLEVVGNRDMPAGRPALTPEEAGFGG